MKNNTITYKIIHGGLAIEGADASWVRKLREDLTVAPLPTPITPNPPSFAAYYVASPSKFVVPFHWARQKLCVADFVEARPLPKPMSSAVRFVGSLQPGLSQPDAVDATLASLRSCGGAVLALHTGYGKTACALYIAAHLGLKTLVVVHQNFLADQWVQRIGQFLPDARVSRVQGGVHDVSGDIVIAMIQTLVSRAFAMHFFDGFGLLCVDECHRIAAPVFGTAMRTLNFKYTLGLSATPQRRDGLENLIHYTLGPLAYQSKDSRAGAAEVCVLRYGCPAYDAPPPINRRGDLDYANMLNAIAANEDRVEFVVKYVAAKLADRDVLILSHRRAHCEAIASALRARGVDAATYLGGDKAVPPNTVIVATYNLVAEGFDEPRLSALVMATPASDVRQAMGRVTRGQKGSDAPAARIVDIVDQWGPCWAQAAKRRKQYAEAGFEVVH